MKEKFSHLRYIVAAAAIGSTGLAGCEEATQQAVISQPVAVRNVDCGFGKEPAGIRGLENERIKELAEENFQAALDFMGSSELLPLQQAVGELVRLKAEEFVVMEPFVVDREPAEIRFYGGFPNPQSSSYRIIISLGAVSRRVVEPANLSTYLYQALQTFKSAEKMKDSGVQKSTINLDDIEAQAWIKTFKDVVEPQADKISDPYIQKLYNLYQKLGEVSFISCWHEAASVNQ